jgi:hypothetical protein
MIRFDGTIEAVEAVEAEIKLQTTYCTIPFIPGLQHDGGKSEDEQGSGIQSARFTRTYDVFGDRVKAFNLKTDTERFRSFITWLVNETIRISFTYDKRDGSAYVSISEENWRKVGFIQPKLKGVLKNIRWEQNAYGREGFGECALGKV